jgi:hypothetical protein
MKNYLPRQASESLKSRCKRFPGQIKALQKSRLYLIAAGCGLTNFAEKQSQSHAEETGTLHCDGCNGRFGIRFRSVRDGL